MSMLPVLSPAQRGLVEVEVSAIAATGPLIVTFTVAVFGQPLLSLMVAM